MLQIKKERLKKIRTLDDFAKIRPKIIKKIDSESDSCLWLIAKKEDKKDPSVAYWLI